MFLPSQCQMTDTRQRACLCKWEDELRNHVCIASILLSCHPCSWILNFSKDQLLTFSQGPLGPQTFHSSSTAQARPSLGSSKY